MHGYGLAGSDCALQPARLDQGKAIHWHRLIAQRTGVGHGVVVEPLAAKSQAQRAEVLARQDALGVQIGVVAQAVVIDQPDAGAAAADLVQCPLRLPQIDRRAIGAPAIHLERHDGHAL